MFEYNDFIKFHRCYVNTPYVVHKTYSMPPGTPMISAGHFVIQEDQTIEHRTYLQYYLWTPVIIFLIGGLIQSPNMGWNKFAHAKLLILFKGNYLIT